MRRLKTSDVYSVSRAISQSGLRAELEKMIREISTGKIPMDVEHVGIDTILRVLELLSAQDAEKTAYEVLAAPFEMTPEEIADLDLDALMANLDALAHDPGLKAFFGALSAMLGKKSPT